MVSIDTAMPYIFSFVTAQTFWTKNTERRFRSDTCYTESPPVTAVQGRSWRGVVALT